MSLPLTRADLDWLLTQASLEREDAVVLLRCLAHPEDGTLLLDTPPGCVTVVCYTCLASVARLAVATAPLALAWGACHDHPAAGCWVLYAGQGMVDVACYTCGRTVVSLLLAAHGGDADVA